MSAATGPWNVVVTGAGGDIGRSTAATFAAAGATVVCVDVDADAVAATAGLIGERAHALVADLSDVGRVDAVLDAAEAALGAPIDALAQLAAVLRRRPLSEVTADDWDRHFDVNAKGTFFLARAFAERCKAAGRHGAVVIATSQSWATGGLDGAVVYAATKGAIVTFSRGMARAYGPAGIRFNTVAPGFVDTGMLHSGLSEGALERMLRDVPMGRLATPEEVAKAIVFLASPDSSYVSGATLVVAGGQLMH